MNNYYTIDEIVALAEDYNIGVNCVYMWPKGETGRLALSVENDDIDSSIKEYMNWVDSSGVCENDPEFAADCVFENCPYSPRELSTRRSEAKER